MKSLFTFLFSVLLFHANAQTLEEVNLSLNASTLFDTYTTGINNRGFVCGYYVNLGGIKAGYVINAKGKVIILQGSSMTPSFTHVTVEGINDSCTIVLSATDGSGNISLYKGYYDSLQESYQLQAVSGNGQPNVAKPYGINNLNVYTGWYPNSTDRWLFTLNDSSASSNLECRQVL